jgi:HK97 family phage major capsid protein
MSVKLEKMYAKSDQLEKELDALVAVESPTDEQKAEFKKKKDELKQLEIDITDLKEFEDIKETKKKPENPGWKPGDKQVAPKGITKDFKDFGDFLMTVKSASIQPGNADYQRLTKAASGLNESVDAEGGFLVQSDFVSQLMMDTYNTGILPNRCQNIPISASSNALTMNGIDETSRANGSRYGGVQAYWENEADQLTGTKPKFRQINLKLKKLTGLCYVTDELLMDAAALGGIIQMAFASEFGFKLDDAIIRGQGAGQPLGILNSGALVTVPAEAGQGADTVIFENIVKMYARCNGRNPEWYINRQLIPQLAFMQIPVGTGGLPVFLPANGAAGRPYNSLMGLPINMLEQNSALGDVGDIILADFADYLLADKGTMESATSIHVRFLYNEQCFRFLLRIDGQPMRSLPITPYKGADTLSSFVTLAAR